MRYLICVAVLGSTALAQQPVKKFYAPNRAVSLYLGGKGESRPAIVLIHGGGWLKGTPEKFDRLARALSRCGFVVANVRYRLGGEAKFPAAVQDCRAAVQFVRANAKQLRVDPNRIAAVGGSAGGHLAGLLATAPEENAFSGVGKHGDVSAKIQACVVLAGPWEIDSGPVADKSLKDPEKSNSVKWIGGSVKQMPKAYRLASPFRHLSKTTCPTLFQMGEYDRPERNFASRKKMRQLGIPAEVRVYSQGKHGCWNRERWMIPMVEDMVEFLRRQMKVTTPKPRLWEISLKGGRVLRRFEDRIETSIGKLPKNRRLLLPNLRVPYKRVFVKGKPKVTVRVWPLLTEWSLTFPAGVTESDTLVIETTERPPLLEVAPLVAQRKPTMRLPAHQASITAKKLRYEPQPHKNTLGYWTNPDDHVRWRCYIEHPGSYRATLLVGCGPKNGGSVVHVIVSTGKDASQTQSFVVQEGKGFQDFKPVELPKAFTIDKPGLITVTVRPKNKTHIAVMDLRQIELKKIP